jgi:hypothetical protein
VQQKITSVWGEKKVVLRQTPRAVTPFGGLSVFIEFLEKIGFSGRVRRDLPVHLRSPNAINPCETFTVFVMSVVAGARRLAHSSLLRADQPLHALLGIKRFPPEGTIRNLFKRFTQGMVVRFYEPLWAWQLARVPKRAGGYSLDLDSAVFERQREQVGGEERLQPEEARVRLPPSPAGRAGGRVLHIARLVAEREHSSRHRGGGISERGPGETGKFGMDSPGASRLGVFR